MTATPPRRTVGILVFEDVEVLDFCGPFEVFASAALPPEQPGGEERHLFEPLILAETMDTVRCRGGLLVVPHRTLDDHPPLDVIVVPGGYGTRKERGNPVILDWVTRQRDAGALVTSVCTGIDMALHVVGRLHGEEIARRTARDMEYDWAQADA